MGTVDFDKEYFHRTKRSMVFFIDKRISELSANRIIRPKYYYISIKDDFSETPGPDTKKCGPFSGEEFFEKCIIPAIKEYNENPYESIVINCDDVYGICHLFIRGAVEAYKKFEDELKGLYIPNIIINNSEETACWDDIKDYVGGTSYLYGVLNHNNKDSL